MYNGATRRSPEEDSRRRRDHHAHSPTHSHPYSPINGTPAQSPYPYPSRSSTTASMPMPSAISPRLGPPPSPKLNGSTHQSPISTHAGTVGSTRYDPLSEHREGNSSRKQSLSNARSPTQVNPHASEGPFLARNTNAEIKKPQSREPLPPYNTYHAASRTPPTQYHSPTEARYPHASPKLPDSHAHPISRPGSALHSPEKYHFEASAYTQSGHGHVSATNGYGDRPSSQGTVDEEPPSNDTAAREGRTPIKRSDPMSFSNILSSGPPEPPKSTPRVTPASKVFKNPSNLSNGDKKPVSVPKKSLAKATSSKASPAQSKVSTKLDTDMSGLRDSNMVPGRNAGILKRKASMISEKENEEVKAEMAKIDALELSDLESSEYATAKLQYFCSGPKRQLALEAVETSKRKRRWIANAKHFSQQLSTPAENGKQRFRTLYEQEALREVQEKEIQDEKERKKDMQRKRRREKTLQQQTQVQKDALSAAERAEDEVEKEKHIKEYQKAKKKVITTQRILERADGSEGIREVTPLPHNLEGGTMTTFQSGTNASPEPPRKKHKGAVAVRPKKSKEKKRAEKESAEAGYAAMQRDELVMIAPKDESARDGVRTRESREVKPSRDLLRDSSPLTPSTLTNYSTKGYNQIYEQIWKDIARKDGPKVCRIKDQSLATKQSNLRKTAQLAAKEARRWQLRTNKGTKDVQARAKRSMREMMTFWKRNERTERDLRKIAEKQEQENQKKEEADKEAKRQKNKLNFLISQTELYSHFIGSKLKTDEIERSTDSKDVGGSDAKIEAGKTGAHTVKLPPSVADVGMKVTNFDQLDFDAEDDTMLKQAAMANAQNAVQDAQDRARAFDKDGHGDEKMAQFDDGDMNFQNPTGLGDIDIPQPKMLTVPLKEYQLKGLNWLAGLYDKGINGILADEMGLGKTVQSISVMAHLAEAYGIWGPFLVVAPSSTLHNWNQEVARFVPDLKVVPYWGTAKDRKVLRKIWDRKHIRYTKDSPFHVLITSYQLVVQDSQYFQKMKWQYMILDEAQAIKSSSSSRWKSLLGFNCRNRLLLTGTPIQNNMQELWALLHFIMPTLFDNHDEFSDWFSKDIENHAQSNSKLNEDQLMRLHTILKPFMLRRVKKHVQKELGDKIEEDVYCDLTYRQRAYYTNLRNKISIMDIIEKAAVGDDQDSATLMNLVMQFRKVCNHPDLFERADTTSPLSTVQYAETASFLREGNNVNVCYSTTNAIEYDLPRLVCSPDGMIDMTGPTNPRAGFRSKYLEEMLNIWSPANIRQSSAEDGAFSWLRFANVSASEAYEASHCGPAERAIKLMGYDSHIDRLQVIYDEDHDEKYTPAYTMLNIVEHNRRQPLAEITSEGYLQSLFNVSKIAFEEKALGAVESCARPGATAPPIQVTCSNQGACVEKENTIFNVPLRKALYGLSEKDELALLNAKVPPSSIPVHNMLPTPLSEKSRYTNIRVPSMRRFVTDSGKLAKLDQLLRQLKEGSHRVLLYFQMTRMIDLMEEYLTYRSYKYLRLDGSTKLEDRRDTVADFQSKPEIFVFLLSTRAGGLGINLTAADTVIFYDSDWNPTIDSQAMDRAHRLGQTKQVTVYRMITRGTIEERIRKRALQKEEVQRVVIQGGGGAGVDFNTRSKDNRTKDMALWLADDEQAEKIEQMEKDAAAKGEEAKSKRGKKSGPKKKDVNIDDMYHEGEGHFDDGSNKPSGAATPIEPPEAIPGKRKGTSKKAKTAKQRLAIADGSGA